MKNFQIYKNLAWINGLTTVEAESVFAGCCASDEWIRRMSAARPFRLVEDVYQAAATIWFSLTPSDWYEVFLYQPAIEPRPAPVIRQFRAESANGSGNGAAGMLTEIEEIKRLYERKFGFVFVANPLEINPAEVITACRQRLTNPVERELQIAAEEQRKIIDIGINRILER